MLHEGERLYEQIQREEEASRWASARPESSAAGPPSPVKSEEGRRITFLELIAWAVIQAEQAAARGDWNKFQAELTRNRIEHWLPMPWPGAKRPDAFERHVLRVARAYTTNSPYSARRELQSGGDR